MQAQNLPAEAQKSHVEAVAYLARRHGKSPDLLTPPELRTHIAECKRRQAGGEYIRTVAGLRFFWVVTLGRKWERDWGVVPSAFTAAEGRAAGSVLRQRMVQDMQLRNLSPKTQRNYVCCVARFARFWNKALVKLGIEEVRTYLVHLLETEKKSVSSYGVASAALRFLYARTLRREWASLHIPLPKREKRLPVILSQAEVACYLEASPRLVDRAILKTQYAAGLRTAEVARLKVTDIDSQRMTIQIRQGKGRKDRYVMLSPGLLEVLREYWRAARPAIWLFPNTKGSGPISPDTVRAACKRAGKAAGLGKHATPKTFRHCFATHSLEIKTADLPQLKLLMGHRSLRSTSVYTHLATSTVCAVQSPLDLLPRLK
jgi:site-specific recombinase XerD